MNKSEPQWAGEAVARITRLAAAYGDPGMSVAVRDRATSWTFITGLESPSSGRLADAQTLFHVGSVGKQFVAIALLRQLERSAGTLNHTLVCFLPDLPTRWHHVTVRQLLQHTSGIPDYIEHVPDDLGLANAELYERIAGISLGFEPGAAWSYSNTNYRLAGDVLATIRGETFGVAMTEFLREMGLTQVHLDDAPRELPHHAEPMRRSPSNEWETDPVFYTINVGSADGGIVLSAEDAVRWCHAFADERKVSPSVRTSLLELPILCDGTSYPYACGLQSETVQTARPFLSHSGVVPGFVAYALHAPSESFAVMVSSNGLQRPSSPRHIAQEVAELVRPGLTAFALPTVPVDETATGRDFARLFREGSVIDPADCADSLRMLVASGFGRPVLDLTPYGRPDAFACVQHTESDLEIMRRYRISWGERVEHVCVVTQTDGRLARITTS